MITSGEEFLSAHDLSKITYYTTLQGYEDIPFPLKRTIIYDANNLICLTIDYAVVQKQMITFKFNTPSPKPLTTKPQPHETI